MARVFKEKRSFGALKLIVFAAVTVALVCLIVNIISSLEESRRSEDLKIMKEAVVRATVQCYALEGRYPPRLEYLEEHYGLTLDRSAYTYHYQPIGENIMPRIDLLPLNGGS
jgi:hypothetical protein